MFMSRSILNKIDPDLMEQMRTQKDENVNVILYTQECGECKQYLETKGIKVKYELPFIEGYCIEIPYGKLFDIASGNLVRYIAADITVECQMNVASKEVGSDFFNRSGFTGKGIGIAFIDTGIYPHTDFTRPYNRIKYFVDFVNSKKSPYDDNGHGTFTAGVASGNGYMSNGRYRGTAPEADIISLKALDKDGGGNASDILASMQWIMDNHKKYNIKVVSMSLGSRAKRSSKGDALVKGVDAMWDAGLTVVVAAGNYGPDAQTITTPGISSRVITVGAVDDKRTSDVSDDTIAEFSSRGPVNGRVKPDVVAPGVNIVSVNADKSYVAGTFTMSPVKPYTSMSGTSVATPIVAGAAAAILQKNTEWKPDQVKEYLMTGTHILNKDPNIDGKGLINLNH